MGNCGCSINALSPVNITCDFNYRPVTKKIKVSIESPEVRAKIHAAILAKDTEGINRIINGDGVVIEDMDELKKYFWNESE